MRKDIAESKSECLVTELESVLVKLEAIAKAEAKKKVLLKMTAYALSPPNRGTAKRVCIQFTGEEILNEGVFNVLATDLKQRGMYLEHGSCGEEGYPVQVKSYKEKLENIDITAWDPKPIA